MQFGTVFADLTEWLITNTVTVVLAIVILAIGWGIAQFLSTRIRTKMATNPNADKTIAPAIAQFARYALYIVTIMLVLNLFGLPLTSMLAVLGAAGLAIALGLRGILSNISSGLMILTLRPMSVGDYIEGAGFAGSVVEIELFNTTLKTPDGIFVFVPNSNIWGVVIKNFSKEPQRRCDINVSISPKADITKARKVLLKIATADTRVFSDPKPIVNVLDFSGIETNIHLRMWTKTSDHWNVKFELTEAVKLAFEKSKIELSVPNIYSNNVNSTKNN